MFVLDGQWVKVKVTGAKKTLNCLYFRNVTLIGSNSGSIYN